MFERLHAFCTTLEQLGFAQEIRESSWLFPTLETVHVVALAVVVGSIMSVDLRLLGRGLRNGPFTVLAREMLPWTWTAFVLASIAGFLMFASKAVTYAENGPFRVKLLLLALAALNMTVFHRLGMRNVAEWDSRQPPMAAKLAGGASLLLWIGVVAAGRWIGFTT
jgi:uncharacterized protein DUF6644